MTLYSLECADVSLRIYSLTLCVFLYHCIPSCALQIDGSVVLVMTDEQLRFYLPAYGDRVATIAWLNSRAGNGIECRPQSPILSRLREKIEKRKALRAASCADTSTAGRTCAKAKCSERRIELGWVHYTSGKYRQVKTANGGGTRHLRVPSDSTVTDLLSMAKDLFFPDGRCAKGVIDDFDCQLLDFSQRPMTAGTVQELYVKTKLKLIRLYLSTKYKICDATASSDESLATDCENIKSQNSTVSHNIVTLCMLELFATLCCFSLMQMHRTVSG